MLVNNVINIDDEQINALVQNIITKVEASIKAQEASIKAYLDSLFAKLPHFRGEIQVDEEAHPKLYHTVLPESIWKGPEVFENQQVDLYSLNVLDHVHATCSSYVVNPPVEVTCTNVNLF